MELFFWPRRSTNRQVLRFGSDRNPQSPAERLLTAPPSIIISGKLDHNAPDNSYCRMAWRNVPRESLITLEWSRLNQTTVVGRLTAKAGFRLVLETYFPSQINGDSSGSFSVDPTKRAILGEQFFNQIFGPTARFVLMADQPLLASGIYPSLAQLGENMRATQSLVSSLADEPTAGAAGMEFNGGASGAVHFVAAIGWNHDQLLSAAQDYSRPEGSIRFFRKSPKPMPIVGRP